jgi:hypothetical protein
MSYRNFFSEVAVAIGLQEGLCDGFVHLDPKSISVEGDYEKE